MLIEIDRSSVAMGDDIESHLRSLTCPEDLRIGELALWAWENYLARVAGDVLWIMASGSRLHPTPQVNLIAIHAQFDPDTGSSAPWFSSLHNRWTPREFIEAAVPASEDGVRRLRFQYISGGGLTGVERYRELFPARPIEQV